MANDDDEEHERRMLTLEELIGLKRLTAISAHGVLGVDDVFYRWDGLDSFVEIFDTELTELEFGVVVNRLDRFVSFQVRTMPPLEWPGLVYAVDEETSKVLVEVGWAHGMTSETRYETHRRVRLNGDREISYVAVDVVAIRFHYLRGGYTPKWLKGTRESTGFK